MIWGPPAIRARAPACRALHAPLVRMDARLMTNARLRLRLEVQHSATKILVTARIRPASVRWVRPDAPQMPIVLICWAIRMPIATSIAASVFPPARQPRHALTWGRAMVAQPAQVGRAPARHASACPTSRRRAPARMVRCAATGFVRSVRAPIGVVTASLTSRPHLTSAPRVRRAAACQTALPAL